MNQRRTLTLGLGAVLLLPLVACTTQALTSVKADGTYCHQIGKSYRQTLTCTPTAVPTAAAEAEAKRFEADPASLTVYLLRRNWADASVVVPVKVDGAATVFTVPESLVRLRLKPGLHHVSAQWDGRTLDIGVEGRPGDLHIVELVGSGWAWGTRFSWEVAKADAVKLRARDAKLVADLDLRR